VDYHAGEIGIQERLGVRDEADGLRRILREEIPQNAAAVLAVQRLAIAATVDAARRPWASLLTGPEGFIAAVDAQLLRLAVPAGGDALLRANLEACADLGLLVLDPYTRLRLRLNGRGMLTPEGIYLLVSQVYGNCQKYIQKRRIVSEPGAAPGVTRSAGSLDLRQQALLARADTLFLATWDPDGGADASHRGGRPGFVTVLDERRVEFPDYPGNKMFNSLGNIARHPRAGLLFADFATGDLLQLTGTARLVGETSLALRIEVEEVRETPAAAGLRMELLEPFPANP